MDLWLWVFFFQAEDGIRDAQESRGLGDVYKRQDEFRLRRRRPERGESEVKALYQYREASSLLPHVPCLLYTSDAADGLLCVDLGGRRIIKKKNSQHSMSHILNNNITQNFNNSTITNHHFIW